VGRRSSIEDSFLVVTGDDKIGMYTPCVILNFSIGG